MPVNSQKYVSYHWGNIHSPWIGADIHIWNQLIKDRPVTHYPGNFTLYAQGDGFAYAYIILSGRVRHSIFGENGQEKQLFISCPGAIIGEMSCILSQPHSITAVTIVPTDIVRIPSKELQYAFHNNHELAELLLQYEARRSQMLIFQQASLTFDSAESRIAKHLIYLSESYGSPKKDGILINLRFTCYELAAIVGTSRVTANNTLLAFQKMNIIEKQGNKYLIKNYPSLESISNVSIISI